MSPTDSTPRALPALVLLALVLAGFAVSLEADFVWDDRPLIVENRRVQDPLESVKLLTSSFWETGDRHDRFRLFFRPAVSLSYALDYALWGLKPFGFHLTNLFLHWLCCWWVFRLARGEGLDSLPALVGAAVFAVHPVHVESVAWISGRTDLLCAVGVLGALLAHRRASATGLAAWRLAACGSFAFALLAKEMAATLPLLIALDRSLDRTAKPSLRASVAASGPYPLVLAGYVALRLFALDGVSGSLYTLSPVSWMATAIFALARYATLLLIPFGLDAHYPYAPLTGLAAPLVLLSLPMLGTLVFIGWRLRPRHPRAAFWLAWCGVSLLPVLAFGRFGDVILADRFLYLPSVGLALLVALGAERIRLQTGARPAPLPAMLALGLVLLGAGLTHRRARVWSDDLTLFRDMLRTSPASALVHCNLGLAHYREGDVAAAIDEYRRAIALVPGYSLAHNNLAAALEQRGHHAAALAAYLEALRHAPGHLEATINAGHLMTRSGRVGEGLMILEGVVEQQPGHARARYALGEALDRLGRSEAAVPHLLRAADADPAFANPHYLLGKIHAEAARHAEAEAALNRFLELWDTEDTFALRARRMRAEVRRARS